jgi:hypothetical protein
MQNKGQSRQLGTQCSLYSLNHLIVPNVHVFSHCYNILSQVSGQINTTVTGKGLKQEFCSRKTWPKLQLTTHLRLVPIVLVIILTTVPLLCLLCASTSPITNMHSIPLYTLSPPPRPKKKRLLTIKIIRNSKTFPAYFVW